MSILFMLILAAILITIEDAVNNLIASRKAYRPKRARRYRFN